MEPGVGVASRRVSRRDFMKLMAASGIAMTFAPFVEWGRYLPNPSGNEAAGKTKIVLASGVTANISSFPVDHAEVVIYPKTNDPVLNKEAFRTWQLIRLPKEMGGSKNDATAFRLYSMVCLHLWCLWRYYPRRPDADDPTKIVGGNGACPCHASTYDVFTGKAYGGPAALQAPPANVLPRLELEADPAGDLWILPPSWNVRGNGIVGYGRYL
ncbi:MAG: twin-arginine translocation signal domain-containing protein [Nitrososphaera sp.]|uniref:QcrA and Rieske domain-containing protein n=1 Tax=Nitrososphaera sp. TaxID=1971748 RepID=UPI0025F6783A|nr:twin-arginine translocation signal domain-containing protein [Nitrososphaera sp.]